MVSTNDDNFYQFCRSLRSHGMVRELTDESLKLEYKEKYPDLNQDFVFIGPSHNFRSTEINAVLGISQLKKLDTNNLNRISNFDYFVSNLDSNIYYTDFDTKGQCNYAFIIIMRKPDFVLRDKIENTLRANGIEFRRGLSGGGNQLRQPYFKDKDINYDNFKNVDHVHNFSWYVGNYPSLEIEKIDYLIRVLNEA